MANPAHLAEFQECLKSSRRIIALVGAGLLASSGLPTFRGSQGLWKNFNLIDLATPDAFYIDPGLVWQFYLWRRHQALQAQPNAGHLALANLSKDPSKEFVTITQNVDGLSGRAGHERENLFEIHGSLFDLRCTSFTCTYVERGNEEDPLTPALDTFDEYESPPARKSDQVGGPSKDLTNVPGKSPQFTPTKELAVSELPLCPACKSLMRPGVVWFGELLPLRVLGAIDDFLETGPVDLILVIGTSGTVYPANGYVDLVRSRGGAVAVFNTDIEPEVLKGNVARTWGFEGDAAEWLPRALACLNE
ncbi:DHS-like NAD/FAD-binding domain-containing protein [Metschnikowia bicuspidata var. bicuspidata NRRL YB-4993]|uniref:NAD-dependent protein deacylase n=1 Tax=Metschnikowia bicuspidata var. bicuspidata NRRL YB-4993 TaxID=869754 RepID=A0A1A0HBS7_9ASCO|nr:DHS-like NAD/FAD-binding domain-containing protein [Metschnikowia bicuspidata var. bicuspidata NRRL YB-4993]OBA21343.1 DHS-like NAD/FAD-binding domain-containing protein [Metschnikowia bicuspidata var. bicuspidata NRRL YB-4993]